MSPAWPHGYKRDFHSKSRSTFREHSGSIIRGRPETRETWKQHATHYRERDRNPMSHKYIGEFFSRIFINFVKIVDLLGRRNGRVNSNLQCEQF